VIIGSHEARDYDAILRKVLAKVDTMTTVDLFEGGRVGQYFCDSGGF
jgi:hypothetical protein